MDKTLNLPDLASLRQRLKEEIAKAQEYEEELSLLICEVHATGQGGASDAAREKYDRSVASFLEEHIRSGLDLPCKIGPRRLAILCLRTGRTRVQKVASKVQQALTEHLKKVSFEGEVRVGRATFPEDGQTVEALLQAAQPKPPVKERPPTPTVLIPKSGRRVVITGLGVVSPIGTGKEAFGEALRAGRSGIRRIERFDASPLPSQIAGEILDFDPTQWMESKVVDHRGRSTQLAVAAAKMSVADSKLELREEDPGRISVIIGSSAGGLEFGEEELTRYIQNAKKNVSPFLAVVVFAGACSSDVSLELGVKGPCITVSTGCAAANDAIGLACESIRSGRADVVITGGTEAPVTYFFLHAFCSLRAVSKRNDDPAHASRPFDKHRDGFVLAEGAGVVILEERRRAERRNAHIYGELLGYAATGDAFHLTRPAPDGAEAAKAVQLALQDAGISPRAIDYVNAHGSSTPLNDKTETAVLKLVLGRHAYEVPISSTKSMTGHAIGASGGIELIATLLGMERSFIHPTINYQERDEECDLDYVPNEAREARINVALSNSFSFGGRNSCLVVAKY